MENKSYTLLIASNRHGETTKITIRASWLKALSFLGFCAVLLAATASLDYVGLLLQANENRSLKQENAALKKQFQVADEKLSSLESSLERIQNFTKKLNLITNVDDDSRAMKLAMNPDARPGGMIDPNTPTSEPAPQGTQAVTRMPSSEFMIREPMPNEHPFSDEKNGELGVVREESRDYASLSVRIDRALKQSQLREQGVLQLWDSLAERQSLLLATPSIKPTRGWFTSRFGYRFDPFNNRATMHAGIDMAAPPGTPVYAPADGVVSYVGYEAGYGKLVSIDHGYGVITRFGHNSRVFVEQGQKVHRWDVISAVGSTGRSTGAHLHYEVRIHGIAVDPINYILTE
ncbi:MAG: M23 family metallopeptidase [Bdellovibrionales bacterium]|nr:M23 family metallopeptidase [Bdellovibrionales bacterium]